MGAGSKLILENGTASTLTGGVTAPGISVPEKDKRAAQ